MVELLTIWSARAAMALFFLALAQRWHGGSPAGARLLWTLGWLASVFHVVWSLGMVHGWSQQAAFDETARRTEETVGVAVGGGLYVNYLFLIVWGADVAFWWTTGLAGYERRRTWIDVLLQAFLIFIVFNATVVFAAGFSRWLGIAGCALLAAAWCSGRACRARAAT